MEERINSFWWVNLTGGDTYEELGVDRRMILKWTLPKEGGKFGVDLFD